MKFDEKKRERKEKERGAKFADSGRTDFSRGHESNYTAVVSFGSQRHGALSVAPL